MQTGHIFHILAAKMKTIKAKFSYKPHNLEELFSNEQCFENLSQVSYSRFSCKYIVILC